MFEQRYIIAGLIGFVFIIFILVGGVKQSDVEKCTAQTGWSEARCKVELSR